MTRLFKNHHGWVAETFTPLPNDRKLRVTTMKRNGGQLATTAAVVTTENGFVTFRMFTDFLQTVHQERVRVTQKAVETQHQLVLKEKLAAIIEATHAHYA